MHKSSLHDAVTFNLSILNKNPADFLRLSLHPYNLILCHILSYTFLYRNNLVIQKKLILNK